jgi:hypothetical protein
MYGSKEECIQSFGRKILMKEPLERDLDVDERIILKWILEKQDGLWAEFI